MAFLMPIASLNPTVKKVRCIGTQLLVHRHPDVEIIDGVLIPENVARIGLTKADVVSVSKKVSDQHGIKAGDVVYIPRALGYQRVEMPVGLCYFVPIESVQAVIPVP